MPRVGLTFLSSTFPAQHSFSCSKRLFVKNVCVIIVIMVMPVIRVNIISIILRLCHVIVAVVCCRDFSSLQSSVFVLYCQRRLLYDETLALMTMHLKSAKCGVKDLFLCVVNQWVLHFTILTLQGFFSLTLWKSFIP